jgi:putative phage-type endonuclease
MGRIDPFPIRKRNYAVLSSAPTVPYVVMTLEQGSLEWKKARLQHVTASDVPPILGIPGYQTRSQVMNIKLNQRDPDVSSFKQRLFEMGHIAEEAGRRYANLKLGYSFNPTVLKSSLFPHLMVSLDGFDPGKETILEAKYLGRESLKDVAQRKLKAHHVAQVQAQLLVSGAKRCMYFAMDPEGNAEVIAIYPDLAMHQKIIAETTKFFLEWQGNIHE